MKVGEVTIVERADTPPDRFFYLPNAETWLSYDRDGNEHRVLPDTNGPVVVCGVQMSEQAKKWILKNSAEPLVIE